MSVISGLVLGAGGILYPREADFPAEYSDRLCSAQEALAQITLPAKHTLRTVVDKYLYSFI